MKKKNVIKTKHLICITNITTFRNNFKLNLLYSTTLFAQDYAVSMHFN